MADIRLAMFLAYKSIFKGNRWALVLIVLVMSLSFANLLLTPSILLGVTETINRQQVETVYSNIVIDPAADQYYLTRAAAWEETISQLPGVTGVSARLDSSALIESEWQHKDSPSDKGNSGNWPVVGVNPEREADVTTIRDHLIDGGYLDADDRGAILLGIEIAGGENAQAAAFQTLQGVTVGDTVRLTYPNGVQREYTVKGIFRARESRADRTAFVTRAELASVLGRAVYADRASQILVSIDDVGAESRIIESIQALGIDG